MVRRYLPVIPSSAASLPFDGLPFQGVLTGVFLGAGSDALRSGSDDLRFGEVTCFLGVFRGVEIIVSLFPLQDQSLLFYMLLRCFYCCVVVVVVVVASLLSLL